MSGAAPPDIALSWRVEEVCFNAFPSLKQIFLGDWLLRFAAGVSRRGNSANLLRPETGDLGRTIPAIESVYRQQQQPTLFRVISIADPALDQALAARGYTSEGETCVLYGPMPASAGPADPEMRLLPTPTEEWLAAMAQLQGHSAAHADTYRRIVGAIAVPARFALLSIADKPAALAFGVLHQGLLCYESVITEPSLRRQGLSRRIIASLAAWAREAGATGLCLQVEAGNTAARALYAGFGLATELHRYKYRREPG